MRIRVRIDSPVPQYEQIRAQIAAEVAAGRLTSGDRLPTVRTLAADLGIAAGTVARAYRELEAAGLASTRRRTGTVITRRAPSTPANVAHLVQLLVAAALEQKMPDQDVLDLIRGSLLAGPRSGPSASVEEAMEER